MGYFDLPRGELELQLKDEKGIHWESVAFTDWLDKEGLADDVERWSKHHEVLAARYNGRPVTIPTNYHWELRSKGEVLGIYKTREEARDEMDRRRAESRRDKTIKVGLPEYVQD